MGMGFLLDIHFSQWKNLSFLQKKAQVREFHFGSSILYSLFWGTYQVDVSQLQMVNCRIYFYNYEHVITQRLKSGMKRPIRS
jgi:hypothetical protein